MSAASAAGTRPRSTRGGRSRGHLAYDLGRRGEPAPAWVRDDEDYAAQYEAGVDDRDAEKASAPPRERTTNPTGAPAPARADDEASSPGSGARTGGRMLPSFSFTSTGGGVTDQVSSALLGLVGYAVVVNFARGGWPQVARWFWAKFTNGGGKLP